MIGRPGPRSGHGHAGGVYHTKEMERRRRPAAEYDYSDQFITTPKKKSGFFKFIWWIISLGLLGTMAGGPAGGIIGCIIGAILGIICYGK